MKKPKKLTLIRETLHLLNRVAAGTINLADDGLISGRIACRPNESPAGCVLTQDMYL